MWLGLIVSLVFTYPIIEVSSKGSPRNAKAGIGGSSMGHNAGAMDLNF
jgi:hypothetical protein